MMAQIHFLLSLQFDRRITYVWLMGLCVLFSCTQWGLDEVSIPEIATGETGTVSLQEVQLWGEIQGLLNQETVNHHGHIWSDTDNLSLENNRGQTYFGQRSNGRFESKLTDLTPGKTYFYQAYIEYEGEIKYGQIQSFSVPTFAPQMVIDRIVRAPDSTSLTISTTYSGLFEGIRIPSYGLTWGDNPQPSIKSDPVSPKPSLNVFTSEFQSETQLFLAGPATYYMRPYIQVGDTTYYGPTEKIERGSFWTLTTDFDPLTFPFGIGFSIGTKGYVGLGRDGDFNQTPDFWEYDTQTDTWTQKSSFPGDPRDWAVSFSIGNKGYMGMGRHQNFDLRQDFWEYDSQSNTWTQKSNLPGPPRSLSVGFSIGNKGYIGTGRGANGAFLYDFWEYDPTLDVVNGTPWVQKANVDIGGPWWDAVGFSIGNKGYIGTGGAGSGFHTEFLEYDPQADTWTRRADFPGNPRRSAVGISIGDKGFIGTGRNGNGAVMSDFWEYDPLSDTWVQQADVGGEVREFAVGFSIGNKGYIGSGTNQNGRFFSDYWEYIASPE